MPYAQRLAALRKDSAVRSAFWIAGHFRSSAGTRLHELRRFDVDALLWLAAHRHGLLWCGLQRLRALSVGAADELQVVDLGGGVLVKDTPEHLREIGAIE